MQPTPGERIRAVATIEATSVSGSAKAVLEFADEARRDPSGVELSLLVFHRGEGRPDNALTEAIARRGLDADLVRESRAFDRGVIPQMRNVLADRHPHLIWTNSVKSHFLVRYAGLHRDRRWVAFHHGYTSTNTKMLLYNQLDRWSLRAADGVLTVCRPFAGELRAMGVPAERIRVQHMPVRPFSRPPEEAVAAVRAEFGIPAGVRLLLTVGRLSKEKGHADLLRALAGVHDVHLLIVGDGPERGPLEALTTELGLGGRVTLAGQQADVAPFYAAADAFVLPSHSEGSPNVLLEAWAAELPVVATSVGGIPEMARDGETAILVPGRNPGALADGLTRLLNATDETRRGLAAAGRLAAGTRHTPEAYYRSLASFFESVARRADQ